MFTNSFSPVRAHLFDAARWIKLRPNRWIVSATSKRSCRGVDQTGERGSFTRVEPHKYNQSVLDIRTFFDGRRQRAHVEQRQLRIETCVYCFRYIGFIVEVSKNHVMRTILQKKITIEVGLIKQAAQVDIQDPPFSTEGAGGIPPVRWPRWAKSRNLYYFWLCNRGKREDVEQAKWNINFSCQDSPTGRN